MTNFRNLRSVVPPPLDQLQGAEDRFLHAARHIGTPPPWSVEPWPHWFWRRWDLRVTIGAVDRAIDANNHGVAERLTWRWLLASPGSLLDPAAPDSPLAERYRRPNEDGYAVAFLRVLELLAPTPEAGPACFDDLAFEVNLSSGWNKTEKGSGWTPILTRSHRIEDGPRTTRRQLCLYARCTKPPENWPEPQAPSWC